MAKILIILLVIVCLCGVPVAAFTMSTASVAEEYRGDDALYSDDGYVDYAEEVYFDVDLYPELADQGLFWNYYDESQEALVEVAADSAAGAALVDTSKPTIIMVHGMITDGYERRDMMILNPEVSNWEEYDIDGNEEYSVAMLRLWLEQGYNVATFHYHKFTAGFIALPTELEAKIWSTDGTSGVSYNISATEKVSNASEYCISEHLVAEYLRALTYLPSTFGDNEIRVVAHSMGGEVSAAALFLMTELATESVGQLDSNQLPDRYAMLDTYFSTNVEVTEGKWLYTGPTDITIRWSGKEIVNNNMGDTIIEALKVLESKGIALEYYSNQMSFLLLGIPDYNLEILREIAVHVIVKPDWTSYSSDYDELSDGHEGVKFWYLSSIWFDDPIVVDADGNATGAIVPSAAMSTEEILALKGTGYVITGGTTTIRTDDDTFIIGYLEDLA